MLAERTKWFQEVQVVCIADCAVLEKAINLYVIAVSLPANARALLWQAGEVTNLPATALALERQAGNLPAQALRKTVIGDE